MSKATRVDLTPKEVSELLDADMDNGKLKWKYRPEAQFPAGYRAYRSWNARFLDKEAFTAVNNHGYKVGTLFGKIYTAHRVVWAIAHGEWPSDQIDHINGLRVDNRLCNLRLTSNSRNHKNQKMPATNTSGVVGVRLEKRTGAWVAAIYDCGRRHYLGTFSEKDEAIAARKAAEVRFGYHPNHGRQNG